MIDRDPQDRDWLLAKSEIVEQPLSSSIPLIGPAIVWLRTRWLNVAARWYIRPMVNQQNDFNGLLINRIRDFESYVYTLSSEHDRDLNRLHHDVAALRQQMARLNRHLHELDEELAKYSEGAGEDRQSSGRPDSK